MVARPLTSRYHAPLTVEALGVLRERGMDRSRRDVTHWDLTVIVGIILVDVHGTRCSEC